MIKVKLLRESDEKKLSMARGSNKEFLIKLSKDEDAIVRR